MGLMRRLRGTKRQRDLMGVRGASVPRLFLPSALLLVYLCSTRSQIDSSSYCLTSSVEREEESMLRMHLSATPALAAPSVSSRVSVPTSHHSTRL